MARLRIKIQLNPGGIGVRLDKLAKISEEVEKFLRFLAHDCGADVAVGEWLAKDFHEGSFNSTIEFVRNVEPLEAVKFNDGIRFFSRFKNDFLPKEFSPETIRQFIEIGETIDADEKIRVGVFDGEVGSPTWEEITKIVTSKVDAVFQEEYRYDGVLQGKLGTWYKDSNYFNLRDLASGYLIKCFYTADMYDTIYGLYDDKNAVVNLSGMITAERISGNVKEMRISWAKSYKPLNKFEFKKLFGLAPDLTGEMDTKTYIDKLRSDGDS